MAETKILVVEDSDEIGELIQLYLLNEGYDVQIVQDGLQVYDLVKQERPDLILLDVLLPGLDGFQICESLREMTPAPILFISCKRDDADKIRGLGVGGDDYITKPFSPDELIARVKAHLRRRSLNQREQESGTLIQSGGLEIDMLKQVVRVDGKTITLSSKEYQLLTLMATHPDQVFHVDQLYQQVWNSDSLNDARTVMVHISNLRKKVEEDPADPRFIITMRGNGYKFQRGE